MIAAHALEYVALAVALGGLFSVVAEVVAKDNLLGNWFGGKTVTAAHGA